MAEAAAFGGRFDAAGSPAIQEQLPPQTHEGPPHKRSRNDSEAPALLAGSEMGFGGQEGRRGAEGAQVVDAPELERVLVGTRVAPAADPNANSQAPAAATAGPHVLALPAPTAAPPHIPVGALQRWALPGRFGHAVASSDCSCCVVRPWCKQFCHPGTNILPFPMSPDLSLCSPQDMAVTNQVAWGQQARLAAVGAEGLLPDAVKQGAADAKEAAEAAVDLAGSTAHAAAAAKDGVVHAVGSAAAGAGHVPGVMASAADRTAEAVGLKQAAARTAGAAGVAAAQAAQAAADKASAVAALLASSAAEKGRASTAAAQRAAGTAACAASEVATELAASGASATGSAATAVQQQAINVAAGAKSKWPAALSPPSSQARAGLPMQHRGWQNRQQGRHSRLLGRCGSRRQIECTRPAGGLRMPGRQQRSRRRRLLLGPNRQPWLQGPLLRPLPGRQSQLARSRRLHWRVLLRALTNRQACQSCCCSAKCVSTRLSFALEVCAALHMVAQSIP